MGKQDSPKSPRPEAQHECLSLGMKDYQSRASENAHDSYIGRRMFGGDNHCNSKIGLFHALKNDPTKCSVSKGNFVGKRHIWLRKHVKSIAFMCLLMGFLFLLDSVVISIFDSMNLQDSSVPRKSNGIKVKFHIASVKIFCCTVEFEKSLRQCLILEVDILNSYRKIQFSSIYLSC